MAELIVGAANDSMFVLQQSGHEGWRVAFNVRAHGVVQILLRTHL
jgi:hypothetical protein